jgi:carboxypeptidase D
MLLNSVLTSGLLALAVGSETVAASKHGRFAEHARAPLENAKRAVEAAQTKHVRSEKDFRFSNKKTESE